MTRLPPSVRGRGRARVAGVMSGTSLDGIDVAIVDIGPRLHLETAGFGTVTYPRAVRDSILAVSNAETHTAAIARLGFLLGELYAEAVRGICREARVPLSSLDLIGCHGQTIFHEGAPTGFLGKRIASTLQIGEAAVLAERTGVPVVSNFRPRDIAAGGAGAPLVPYADYLLFRHARRGRVALNIGGIANVTAIPPGAPPEAVVAFDTGPGNMVIDALVEIHTRGRLRYDRNGRIAASSSLNKALLGRLLADPYYAAKPPKTAGREQYGRKFVEKLIATRLAFPTLIATATALTAGAVAGGVERFVRPRMAVDELIVSGGGAANPQMMRHLAAFLPGTAVCASDDYGIDSGAKEAIAFAVLAYQTWRGRPANLPSATGARHPVILGDITL